MPQKLVVPEISCYGNLIYDCGEKGLDCDLTPNELNAKYVSKTKS